MLIACDARKKPEAKNANLILGKFFDWCLLLLGAHGKSPGRSRSVRGSDRRCRERSSSSSSSPVPYSTLSPTKLQKSQKAARQRTSACRRPRALSRAWPRCQGRSCRPPAVREHHRWSASSARPGTAPQRPRHIGSSRALPTEDAPRVLIYLVHRRKKIDPFT